MSTVVAVIVAFLKTLWPAVEPMLLPLLTQVAQTLGAQLLAQAKTQTLPAKYAVLGPALLAAENELSAFLSPTAIAAEVEKLAGAKTAAQAVTVTTTNQPTQSTV
jgi:hypothetical protein